MKLGLYHDSPRMESLSSLKKKKYALSHASLPKNPQYIEPPIKLPSINTHRSINLSSLVNERNTKNKLSNLQHKLQELRKDIHNERMDANQTLKHVRFLKEEYAQNQMQKTKDKLKLQVEGLNKLVRVTKMSNENRTQEIRQDYNRLWQRTEELRQVVFEIQMKVQNIDRIMGNDC